MLLDLGFVMIALQPKDVLKDAGTPARTIPIAARPQNSLQNIAKPLGLIDPSPVILSQGLPCVFLKAQDRIC